MTEPLLTARNLVKRYGRVTAMDHADFDLYPGEILAVIGDNGAGKSSLIKAISGAVKPDEGEIRLNGQVVSFDSPLDARKMGIETVYQTLALSPALSISDNMFMGREIRKKGIMGQWFGMLDKQAMDDFARAKLSELGLMTIQNIAQPVETLSGGQRQGVAVARAAAFGSRVIILDEPTAALGVKESRRVLDLIQDVRSRGIPIVLISHNMPHVFRGGGPRPHPSPGQAAVRDRPQATFDVGCRGLHDRRARTRRGCRLSLASRGGRGPAPRTPRGRFHDERAGPQGPARLQSFRRRISAQARPEQISVAVIAGIAVPL